MYKDIMHIHDRLLLFDGPTLSGPQISESVESTDLLRSQVVPLQAVSRSMVCQSTEKEVERLERIYKRNHTDSSDPIQSIKSHQEAHLSCNLLKIHSALRRHHLC